MPHGACTEWFCRGWTRLDGGVCKKYAWTSACFFVITTHLHRFPMAVFDVAILQIPCVWQCHLFEHARGCECGHQEVGRRQIKRYCILALHLALSLPPSAFNDCKPKWTQLLVTPQHRWLCRYPSLRQKKMKIHNLQALTLSTKVDGFPVSFHTSAGNVLISGNNDTCSSDRTSRAGSWKVFETNPPLNVQSEL